MSNSNDMYNQQPVQQQTPAEKYTMQKRVYRLMFTYANGNTEQVGHVNLSQEMIKTADKFAGLEQRLDHGLNVGTIIFGEGFSVIATDKGVIKNTANDFAPLSGSADVPATNEEEIPF